MRGVGCLKELYRVPTDLGEGILEEKENLENSVDKVETKSDLLAHL